MYIILSQIMANSIEKFLFSLWSFRDIWLLKNLISQNV